MSEDNVILEFEHVCGKQKIMSRAGGFILSDINFKLQSGYIMGLAGENGAGKSTLIETILNPKRIQKGTIRIGGMDTRTEEQKIRNQIGFVSEENRFFFDRSAKMNAKMLGSFFTFFSMDIFEKSMKSMSVSVEKLYGNMSRGERLKFQMAFAMAHQPKLFLLDEVTAGMDPVFRMEFFEILSALITKGDASVLMTTHIATEMKTKTDFLGILENGRLISFGESIDLVENMHTEMRWQA